ncbi:hypothetical protein CWC46_05225 [Prodigiosinella confusarubida]|uniref:Uncharacterized protein n=1 Tax=Serratia sp. (strain ATCC 39006) TaxID=104623 RepID=A0A2I5T3Y5_SERS3|nr:hypothetical protein CWC46_05225 [Serratia sp. ATCC 39006]AUH03587.1 hypothetical protein Ser39006_005230 [Serratia sp. ATCC 39006]
MKYDRYRYVRCFYSPQSLTDVNSWGLTRLPPSCYLKFIGYKNIISTEISVSITFYKLCPKAC